LRLTRKEADCLAFIEAFFTREGVTPTMREIIAGLGLKSTSGANRLVNALVERGRIRRLPNRARGLALVRTIHCPNCHHEFEPFKKSVFV
jgi:repressor LexA